MRYTTLIQLPVNRKDSGGRDRDKDFWIIEPLETTLPASGEGRHPLQSHLITDKGTVYSFTLDDVETVEPDLKVVIEPSDPSSLAAPMAHPNGVLR